MQPAIDDESLSWIESNKDGRWSKLLEYWRGLVARLGRMPKRSEIDPLEIGNLLPNLFLMDVVRADGAAPRYRFRLLGGAITDRESVRPGQYLDDFKTMRDSDKIMRHYRNALDGRIAIRSATLAWDHPTKEFITYHVLLLPLSEDGRVVDTILGLAIYEA
jgi:hypothetical protein